MKRKELWGIGIFSAVMWVALVVTYAAQAKKDGLRIRPQTLEASTGCSSSGGSE